MSADEPVLAAGGVITREPHPDGAEYLPMEYLVVHRPRYDDWSLPKGKLEPGESLEDVAPREVEEETGLVVELGEPLPSTEYVDRHGRPKVVHYWRMTPIGDAGFEPNDEVDRTRWITAAEAATLLSYEHDRRLIAGGRGNVPRRSVVTVYLVRHAKAGERNVWEGDDRLRPLSGRGHLQARGLVDMLKDAQFDRLLSSPYVRCMETVVPLSGVRRVAIEPVDALAEGASLEEALALVRKHAAHGAVFCTHGDVIPMLLEHYATHEVDIGVAPQWPKGSTWALDTDPTGEVTTVRYLPPPPD